MKNLNWFLFLIILFSLSLVGDAAAETVDQCFTCHNSVVGDRPGISYQKDIHYQKGITCADCHGGNPASDDMEEAMSRKNGFVGKPTETQIPQLCGKCHGDVDRMKKYGSSLPTDILEKYQNSIHGKITARGDRHVAQCITCHGVHDIVPVNNPRSPVYPLNVPNTCNRCHGNAAFMKQYNPSLPVDQHQKYLTSLHGKKNKEGDIDVAQCANCHSAHDIRPAADPKSSVYALNLPKTCARCHSDVKRMARYGIPTDQFEGFSKGVHGIALLQKHDTGAPACNDCHGNHGSTPPGVESISNVCGVCHALNSEMFAQSPHKKVFDEKKLPECETCHGNHMIPVPTDEMLGVAPGANCAQCHTNPATKGYQVAARMRTELDSLLNDYAKATHWVQEAQQKGMEVTDFQFALKDVRQNTIEVRTSIHTFQLNTFQQTIQKGFKQAGAALEGGKQAISEFYFRRKGLGVSTLLITIVVILLYWKIKEIEKKQKS